MSPERSKNPLASVSTESWIRQAMALFTGLVAMVTYMLTMAPTVSFWDCGEFIACAHTLGIPHPPGTPFFVILGRAVIIAMPWVEEVAKRVNYISVFTSAATVYLISLFAWDLLGKFVRGKEAAGMRITILSVASLCAGLLLAFSDTFWFNAVEAEVYGLAMLMVVFISWLGLRWIDHRTNIFGDKILVLIAYVAFLGVGVHLYTLLTIPAVFVLLLLADQDRIRRNVISAAVSVGLFIVLWIIFGKIAEGTWFAALAPVLVTGGLLYFFDKKGENLPDWPIWFSGVVLYSVVYAASSFRAWSLTLLILLLVLRNVLPSNMKRATGLAIAFAVIALVGWSTHLYIPIRSALNPVIDENDPELRITNKDGKIEWTRIFADEAWDDFDNFIERKQYGSESMISRAFHRRGQADNQWLTFPNMGYGGYQLAQYTPFKVGQVAYYSPGQYQIVAEENKPLDRGAMQYPTQMMFMGESTLVQLGWFLLLNGLITWAVVWGWKRNRAVAVYMALLYLISSAGLVFYINFSDGTRVERRDRDAWMQGLERDRQQLMQNGVQIPSIPDPNDLHDIRRASTLPGADKGKVESHPTWQAWKRIQSAYTAAGARAPELPDPVHLEVRERDYFYSPAFIFMSLLYGVGAGMLLFGLTQMGRTNLVRPIGLALVIVLAGTPLYANYKEHTRANLWVPWDYAYNLLMSCEPNGILFTNGDNDTFPLWFAQEVAGIRKDVRVVNLSLGNTGWYIKQMLEIPPLLKLSYTKDEIFSRMELSEDNMSHADHRVDTWVNKAEQALPVWRRQIEIFQGRLDSATDQGEIDRLRKEIVRRTELVQIYDALQAWGKPRTNGYLKTQDKLVIDLVQNNPDRPIHFATTVSSPNFVGLDRYMLQQGMVFTLQKGNLDTSPDRVDVARTKYLVDSVYQFRGLGDNSAYINDETKRLLFNYNSIYLRLSLESRAKLAHARLSGDSLQMQKELQEGMRYMELASTQFPEEWRNYAIMAELLETAGKRTEALSMLEQGIKKVDDRARTDLEQRLRMLQGSPQTLPPGEAQE